MCRDLDLVEFRVRLLFTVVVFLIEERNQFVYLVLLLVGFLTLEISYLSVYVGCFRFLFGFPHFRS